MRWLIILIIILVFIGIALTGCIPKPPPDIKNESRNVNDVIFDDQDSPIVQELKTKCNIGSTRDKIKCVLLETERFYRYIENNDSIRTPQETFDKGGVCSDWTNYYCNVFRAMNVECQAKPVNDTHVIALVSFNENMRKNIDVSEWVAKSRKTYCTIDGTHLECW